MLVNIIAATFYFYILAAGRVPLNTVTLIFSVVYALLGYVSVISGLNVYRFSSVVYITVISGAIGTILPFLYELLFTDIYFSTPKIISVFFRIAAICVVLFFDSGRRTTLRGTLLCIFLGVINGCAAILIRMYATYPGVMSDGSLFFWTNVFTLPMILVSICKRTSIKSFVKDIKSIRGYNYVYCLGGMLINNAITFISIEIIRHISGTVYNVINGSVHLLASAFISAFVYKENVSLQSSLSVILSIFAVILSLM